LQRKYLIKLSLGQILGLLGHTVFENVHQRFAGGMDALKMIRTIVGGGRDGDEFPMYMMMSS
jgi:hypothetical protein